MSKKSWVEIIAAALTVAGALLKRRGDRDRDRDRDDEKSERDRGKSRPKPRR